MAITSGKKLKAWQGKGFLMLLNPEDLKLTNSNQKLAEINYYRMKCLCSKHGHGNLGCCQYPLNWWSYQ